MRTSWLCILAMATLLGCDDSSSNTNNNVNNVNNINNINNVNNVVNNINNINNLNNINNNNNQDGGPDVTDVVEDADADGGTVDPVPVNFKVLTANVGHGNAEFPNYPLRLWSQSYEDYMGAIIQGMSPDVVVLQEVLSGKTCDAFTEIDPNKTCYDWDTRLRPAVRLIGPGYSIVCDQREQVECIGVKVAFGTIEGVEPGAYVELGAHTPGLPMPGCNWAEGECTNATCDDESTVSDVLVHTAAGDLRVVHMHPTAQVSAFVAADPCRADQLRQVFENGVLPGDVSMVRPGEQALIIGDWNVGLEVYSLRTIMQTSEADDVWYQYIDCPACAFTSLDPREGGNGDRYSTTSANSWAGIVAIDHVVVTNEITGACVVHDEGGMPGTDRLDVGYPHLDQLGDSRTDHYAISCEMTIYPPAP